MINGRPNAAGILFAAFTLIGIYPVSADAVEEFISREGKDGNYTVFFTSDRDIENSQALQKDNRFHTEIYRMNPDGSEAARLTSEAGMQSFLTPAPDGGRLYYVQGTDEDTEIAWVTPDGGDRGYLDENFEANNYYPTLNAAGDRIIFTSVPNVETYKDNDEEIFTMNLETGAKQKITDNDLNDSNPAVSPDQTSMVYLQSRERIVPEGDENMYSDLKLRALASRNVLYKYDFQTRKSTPLYKEELHYMYPVFSPDGRYIAVTVNYGGVNFETLVLTPSGEEAGAFSFSNYGCGKYHFNSDSSRLYFMCTEPEETGRQGIYYVDIANRDFNPSVVTEDVFFIKDYALSPDDKTVFFSGSRSDNYTDWNAWEIYRIGVDGSGLANLTNNNSREWFVAVGPDAAGGEEEE